MKIALLGYGKMGRLVEAIAMREGWEVGPKLDIGDNVGGKGITAASMEGVDVALDFSLSLQECRNSQQQAILLFYVSWVNTCR